MKPLASVGRLLAACLLAVLLIPLLALATSSSPSDVVSAASDPMFAAALALSLKTTLLSLALTLLMGTPLAWWLARSTSRWSRAAAVVVELPVVLPPAVVGIALLFAWGRRGPVGAVLEEGGVSLPFSTAAVVVAQLVVASPFYVQAAAAAFRRVDPDLLVVARTLGASQASAVLRVALPVAFPGLLAGASLSWARALGEFGATLLFAGNLPGETQTMPLAIFSALESDIRLAVVFSLVLAATGILLLVGLRWGSDRMQRSRA
ncbi:MAG: ABC transporter permease [Myxococcota bacterium]